jgi:large subunit ribosomal protein L31
MKTDIHPKWHADAQVTCACGNSFTVGSTKPSIRVEICHKCHPFFTGEMKYVDTLGRVEKFQKRQEAAKITMQQVIEKKKKKQERQEQMRNPKSLREMLLGGK